MSPASFLSWSSAATVSTLIINLMPREATASVHRKAGQAYSIQCTHCTMYLCILLLSIPVNPTDTLLACYLKRCHRFWFKWDCLICGHIEKRLCLSFKEWTQRKYLKLHVVSVCIELQPRVPPVWRDKWISDYCLLNNGFASADHGTRSHNSIIRQAGR